MLMSVGWVELGVGAMERIEIRTKASSSRLIDLRSHRSASFVTESKRAKRAGRKGRSPAWALREAVPALSVDSQPLVADERAPFPVIGAEEMENTRQTLVGKIRRVVRALNDFPVQLGVFVGR
ncbi:hypothetical protein FF2_035873 [Malus domestica]